MQSSKTIDIKVDESLSKSQPISQPMISITSTELHKSNALSNAKLLMMLAV